MTDEPTAPSDSLTLSPRGSFWIGFAALYVFCLIAFFPAIGAGFIWDDNVYVTGNSAINRQEDKLEGMRQIWLGGADPDTYPGPQFYPMTYTSFWMEFQLWGLKPSAYHVTNILLHATGAMLLWLILRKLKVPGAWVCAAIFAIHPVQVESVAWITERKNTLSGVFYFLSALVYLRFCGLDPAPLVAGASCPRSVAMDAVNELGRDAPATGDENEQAQTTASLTSSFVLPSEPWKVYALALLLFAGALLSKSVTGSLPAVLLLVIWWKRGRIDLKNDLVPLLPFFALAIGMGRVTSWYEAEKVGAQGADFDFTLIERILIAGRALWFYTQKLLLPHPLVFTYPKWNLDPQQVTQFVFPALAVAVPLVLLALRKRIGRGPLVAVLIFGGTLVPALGFFNVFPMRYSYVADHFQYLACIGLIVLAVATVHALVNSPEARTGIASVVLVVFGALSIRQSRVYENLNTLWTHVIERNPDSWMAYNNMGTWYFNEATQNSFSAKQQSDNFNRAIEHYGRARELKKRDLGTDNMEAVIGIGVVAERIGNFAYAQKRYEEAVTLIPPDGKRFGYYAKPYFHLGVIFTAQGKVNDAVISYRKALELNPRYVLALNNLGSLMLEQNKLEEAIDLLAQAVEIEPSFAGAHLNLGNALLKAGKMVEAVEQWKTAQKLAPDDEKPLIQMGTFLAGYGRFDEAENAFRRAPFLNPRSLPARTNLAIILIQKGFPADAIEHLDLVLKVDPGNAIATKQRAIATTMPTTQPTIPSTVPSAP